MRAAIRHGAVLGQAFFRTRAHSYVHTLDDVLFGAAELPARACRSILAGAEPSPAQSEPRRRAGPQPAAPHLARRPTNRERARPSPHAARRELRPLAAHGDRLLPAVERRRRRRAHTPVPRRVLRAAACAGCPKSPRARFVADPFGLPDGSAPDGWSSPTTTRPIAASSPPSIRAGRSTPRESVLPVDTHASYPYLVRHRGRRVLRAAARGRRRDPDLPRGSVSRRSGRTRASLVPDVAARDPTLFEHDGRWWLTYTDAAAPLTDLHAVVGRRPLRQLAPARREPGQDRRALGPTGGHAVRARGRALPPCPGLLTVLRRRRGDLPCRRAHAHGVPRGSRTGGPIDCRVRTDAGTHTLAAVGDTTLVDGKRFVFTSRTGTPSRDPIAVFNEPLRRRRPSRCTIFSSGNSVRALVAPLAPSRSHRAGRARDRGSPRGARRPTTAARADP